MPNLSHHHQSPKTNVRNNLPYLKTAFLLLSTFAALFTLSHITSLTNLSSPSSAWSFTSQWQTTITTTATTAAKNCSTELQNHTESTAEKLRRAVTFLPLKDLRFADDSVALEGHTMFMSSLYDNQQPSEVQYQHFPSESSHGRLLCLKGKDKYDGTSNSYALVWPETLPHNATLMKGLTFVSYNHYDYDNIWHGLSSAFPFVAWHQRSNCSAKPRRWILFHLGQLRLGMAEWLSKLMEATFGESPAVEGFEAVEEESPVCFEEAAVMHHCEGGMSMERRLEGYDLIRCKVRWYYDVAGKEKVESAAEIRMTVLMRRGARSFRNEMAVVEVLERECGKVDGCKQS